MTPDEPRSPLDDTIDRVAAAMTDAHPTRDLRACVIARLDEPRATRINWALVSAGAAAAALVVAVLAPRLSKQDVQPPVATAAANPAVNALAPAESGAVESLETAVFPLQTARTAANLDELEHSGVEMLPLLEAPAPIWHETIQPEKLSIPQLTVAAIVVPAVDDGSVR